MTPREPFDLWDSEVDFDFINLPPVVKWCEYGQRFFKWCEALCQLGENPDTYAVQRAMLLLTKKYFEWRSAVPKSHRDCIGSKNHVCIYQVFVETYGRLQVMALSQTPLLFEPSPPSPPAPQIPVLALGIKED